jgi:hypothetical protein
MGGKGSKCQVFTEEKECEILCRGKPPKRLSPLLRAQLAECRLTWRPGERSQPYQSTLIAGEEKGWEDRFEKEIVARLPALNRPISRLRQRATHKGHREVLKSAHGPLWIMAHNDEDIAKLVRRIVTLFPPSMHVSDIVFLRVLGSGAFGVVLLIADKDNLHAQFAVKIQFREPDFAQQKWKKEFTVQKSFSRRGLAVKPIAQSSTELPYLMLMPKIDRILIDRLQDIMNVQELLEIYIGLLDLIYRMCKANMYHHDFHAGNIGITYNIETRSQYFILLDFGMDVGVNSKTTKVDDCRSYSLDYVKRLIKFLQEFEQTYNYEWLLDRLRKFKKALKTTLRT